MLCPLSQAHLSVAPSFASSFQSFQYDPPPAPGVGTSPCFRINAPYLEVTPGSDSSSSPPLQSGGASAEPRSRPSGAASGGRPDSPSDAPPLDPPAGSPCVHASPCDASPLPPVEAQGGDGGRSPNELCQSTPAAEPRPPHGTLWRAGEGGVCPAPSAGPEHSAGAAGDAPAEVDTTAPGDTSDGPPPPPAGPSDGEASVPVPAPRPPPPPAPSPPPNAAAPGDHAPDPNAADVAPGAASTAPLSGPLPPPMDPPVDCTEASSSSSSEDDLCPTDHDSVSTECPLPVPNAIDSARSPSPESMMEGGVSVYRSKTPAPSPPGSTAPIEPGTPESACHRHALARPAALERGPPSCGGLAGKAASPAASPARRARATPHKPGRRDRLGTRPPEEEAAADEAPKRSKWDKSWTDQKEDQIRMAGLGVRLGVVVRGTRGGLVVQRCKDQGLLGRHGLQPHDVLVAWNDRPMHSEPDLRECQSATGVGGLVRLAVRRPGVAGLLTMPFLMKNAAERPESEKLYALWLHASRHLASLSAAGPAAPAVSPTRPRRRKAGAAARRAPPPPDAPGDAEPPSPPPTSDLLRQRRDELKLQKLLKAGPDARATTADLAERQAELEEELRAVPVSRAPQDAPEFGPCTLTTVTPDDLCLLAELEGLPEGGGGQHRYHILGPPAVLDWCRLCDLRWFSGPLSRPHTLVLYAAPDDPGPLGCLHCAFAYPLLQGPGAEADGGCPLPAAKAFLAFGGFVHYDDAGTIVHMTVLSDRRVLEAEAGAGGHQIHFGPGQPVEAEALGSLRGLLQPVRQPARCHGAAEYAWVPPGSVVGGARVGNGGFVFTYPDEPCARLFEILRSGPGPGA